MKFSVYQQMPSSDNGAIVLEFIYTETAKDAKDAIAKAKQHGVFRVGQKLGKFPIVKEQMILVDL